MLKKISIKESSLEIMELAKESFPTSNVPLQEIKNIFSQVNFGEIHIKVINGEVESIQIIQNFKPIDLTKEEN